jgi:hypothetical protein
MAMFKTAWRLIKKYLGWIEGVLLLYLALKLSEGQSGFVWLCCFVPFVYRTFWNLKWAWFVYQGKKEIEYSTKHRMAQKIEGSQGAGKSSYMHAVASYRKAPTYCNVPAETNGKLDYIFSDDVVNMKVKILEGSTCKLDEATVYWHNLEKRDKEEVRGNFYSMETLLQFIRHFIGFGLVMAASVVMERLPAQMREKMGVTKRMMGRGYHSTSFLQSFVLDPFCKIVGIYSPFGLYSWTYQQFEGINQQGYVYNLAEQVKPILRSNNRYAALVRWYVPKCDVNFKYDDRFMKVLYDKVAIKEPERFKSLLFNFEALKATGFRQHVEFFEEKIKDREFDEKAKMNDLTT